MDTKTILAKKLLAIKAIRLSPEKPFTWASGWKSPFYCDNRKTLSYPSLRTFVKLELARIVGGEAITDSALNHAKQLLNSAKEI